MLDTPMRILTVMLFMVGIFLLIFFTHYAVMRREGILLLGLYIVYTLYLVLGATCI